MFNSLHNKEQHFFCDVINQYIHLFLLFFLWLFLHSIVTTYNMLFHFRARNEKSSLCSCLQVLGPMDTIKTLDNNIEQKSFRILSCQLHMQLKNNSCFNNCKDHYTCKIVSHYKYQIKSCTIAL